MPTSGRRLLPLRSAEGTVASGTCCCLTAWATLSFRASSNLSTGVSSGTGACGVHPRNLASIRVLSCSAVSSRYSDQTERPRAGVDELGGQLPLWGAGGNLTQLRLQSRARGGVVPGSAGRARPGPGRRGGPGSDSGVRKAPRAPGPTCGARAGPRPAARRAAGRPGRPAAGTSVRPESRAGSTWPASRKHSSARARSRAGRSCSSSASSTITYWPGAYS